MAIDVNRIYTTVLSIMNKKGNGYLTPDSFNKIAKVAQIDLLDKAFYEYNNAVYKQVSGRGAAGYGDIPKKVKDKIDPFYSSTTLPVYIYGSLIKGDITNSLVDADAAVNTTDGTYTNVSVVQTTNPTTATVPNGGLATIVIEDSKVKSLEITYPGKDFYVGTAEISTIGTTEESNIIFTIDSSMVSSSYGGADYPTDLTDNVTEVYKIITVSANNRRIQIEEVAKTDLIYLMSSPLTTPTTTFPIFYTVADGIIVEPVSTTGLWGIDGNPEVILDYIQTPIDPKWGYSSSISNYGTPTYEYSTTASQNFTLHPSEEAELVAVILNYFGITIKDPLVIQSALQEQSSIIQQEN